MARIKIISNPYEKRVIFQKHNEFLDTWETLDFLHNNNSLLISKEFLTSFFPFKAKKAVDTIIKEYMCGNEKVNIVFEGTEDEYKDLSEICSSEAYSDKIILTRSDRFLCNARDILPGFEKIFNQMQSLIIECVDEETISFVRNQFADVSKEEIPICVLGNYSSGKSTFINALLGYEILPSGDESLTSRIHQIRCSGFDDRASIGFKFDKTPVFICFHETGYETRQAFPDGVMFEELKNTLESTANDPIPYRMNRVLEIINEYDKTTSENKISAMLEITVPLNKTGLLSQSKNKFVIFDTPGSNAASNTHHMDILRTALHNFSNGLPLYISEYSELDSTDNEKLCNEIINMEELDSRFTMIVVNKADNADIPKKLNPERVMAQTIPKNLNAEQLFFVSSIMGLGSKVDGEFANDYYAEIFEGLKIRFSDPDNRFYKTLYANNILPTQMKDKCVKESSECENMIFANSGLFWIEKEIETFASKYSPYNKCQQSLCFLNKIISITADQISEAKKGCLADKEQWEQKLDTEKKELITTLDANSKSQARAFNEDYQYVMKKTVEKTYRKIEQTSLEEKEKDLTEQRKKEASYTSLTEQVAESKKAVSEKKEDEEMSFSDKLKHSRDAYVKYLEKVNILKKAQKEIDKSVADEMFRSIKEYFADYIRNSQNALNNFSMSYLHDASEKIRQVLIETVTGSSSLSEEKKEELEQVIMSYSSIEFDKNADEIFHKADFERNFSIFGIMLFENNKLRLDKLTDTFNSEAKKAIDNICKKIQERHKHNFDEWVDNLLALIKENITDYNPTLKAYTNHIEDKVKRINRLTNRQSLIQQYSDDMFEMTSWQNRT